MKKFIEMRVLHTPSSSAITRVTRPIRTLPDTLRPIPYDIIEIQCTTAVKTTTTNTTKPHIKGEHTKGGASETALSDTLYPSQRCALATAYSGSQVGFMMRPARQAPGTCRTDVRGGEEKAVSDFLQTQLRPHGSRHLHVTLGELNTNS